MFHITPWPAPDPAAVSWEAAAMRTEVVPPSLMQPGCLMQVPAAL